MTDWQPILDVLKRGGVVACPTETFVGLLADAANVAAVERVAEIKGRRTDTPIAVLLPDAEAVSEVARPLSDEARALASAHWPGPLTIVASARPGMSPWLLSSGKIGMRVPGPSPALDVVQAFGHPLTATSANVTGEPPVRSERELSPALRDMVDAVVPGKSPGGSPSTVVDVTRFPFVVLRQGAVALGL